MTEAIYTVHVTEDHERRTIVVLVADSASEAAEKAIGHVPGATLDDADAGRLGDYAPGISGAALSRGAVIAIQRVGQR